MGNRIRVLYMIGTLDVGGAEGQLVELAMGLDRTRFEPAVYCLAWTGPHSATLEAAGIPVHVLGFHGLMASRNLHHGVLALARLVGFMRSWRPDVVHGFLFWAYVIAAFAARAARVPVVLASRRSLSHFKQGAPYRHFLFLERLANRLTDLVIANSEAVRADAVSTEGLPPGKVIVIPNGLDLERYDVFPDSALRAALGVRAGAPVVGVIANFIAYKGHELFLDAWTRVVRRIPGAVALLIGEGPVRAHIEARAEALGVAGSLRFLGMRRDVPALLALMDVVAHPSSEEGFSNAILEAMAAGKPVVATAVGGNPEAMRHEETGLLVAPADAQALADGIVSLLDDPATAAKSGAAGRQRVAERFTLQRMVRDYETLYEGCLRTAPSGVLRRRPDVRDRRTV